MFFSRGRRLWNHIYSNYPGEVLSSGATVIQRLKVAWRRPVSYSTLCAVSPIQPMFLIGCVSAAAASDLVTHWSVTSMLLCSACQPHLTTSHSLASAIPTMSHSQLHWHCPLLTATCPQIISFLYFCQKFH